MRALLVMALALVGVSAWTAAGRADDDNKKKSADTERGFLGVMLDQSDENAIKITGFAPESPAEKAGLKEGDVIVKVNDKSVKGMEELQEYMAKTKPGDKVSVTVKRDDKEQTISVTLGTKPKDD